MNKRNSSCLDQLGAEAGIYVPARTLGEVAPPPRSLRVAVTVVIALVIVAATLTVQTVPEVAHAWRVVAHQTETALSKVLGTAEVKTTEFVGDLAGQQQH